MKQVFFITGTDTGIGKTHVACKLINDYAAKGYKVVGMKPVAAGEEFVDGAWVNEDVLKLETASNVKAPRSLTNPYSFKESIAPHIAAEKAGVQIETPVIKQAFNELKKLADIVIVEGAGGFLVPLNGKKTMADLTVELDIPVVLVVGMRLGCINHSFLTAEAIKARNLNFHGWIANKIAPDMPFCDENISAISQNLRKDALEIYEYSL
jgi:dethiobiotin synthetase